MEAIPKTKVVRAKGKGKGKGKGKNKNKNNTTPAAEVIPIQPQNSTTRNLLPQISIRRSPSLETLRPGRKRMLLPVTRSGAVLTTKNTTPRRTRRLKKSIGEKKFDFLKKYSNMKLEKGAYKRTVLALYKKNVRYVFDPVPNDGEGEWKKYTNTVLHVKPRAVKINKHRRGKYIQWGKIIGPIGYPGAYKDGVYVRKKKR